MVELKIAIDYDGTITAHPEFFRTLYYAWRDATMMSPIILTARMEHTERASTLTELAAVGIYETFVYGVSNLHMYPHTYEFPYRSVYDEQFSRARHALWKAQKCKELDVTVLIDDCEHNTKACQQAGILVLQVKPPLQFVTF